MSDRSFAYSNARAGDVHFNTGKGYVQLKATKGRPTGRLSVSDFKLIHTHPTLLGLVKEGVVRIKDEGELELLHGTQQDKAEERRLALDPARDPAVLDDDQKQADLQQSLNAREDALSKREAKLESDMAEMREMFAQLKGKGGDSSDTETNSSQGLDETGVSNDSTSSSETRSDDNELSVMEKIQLAIGNLEGEDHYNQNGTPKVGSVREALTEIDSELEISQDDVIEAFEAIEKE